MSTETKARVRMYNVGELGDCFLITLTHGEDESNVLIDCGSFRNSGTSKAKLNEIVTHIKSTLKNKKLDVVVGTHQHNDHVSGFVHCKEQFEGLIDQVWLSWLDDPTSKFSKKITDDREKLVSQLRNAHALMAASGKPRAILSDVLDFFGASEEGPMIPAQGVSNLKKMSKRKPRYLTPGTVLALPGMPEDIVKVYVLGPPLDKKKLFDTTPGKEESYDHSLAMANVNAARVLSALGVQNNLKVDEEENYPFNKSFERKPAAYNKELLNMYNAPESEWRKIDDDWMDQADRLGLYLDSYTNNSSLVLAFELVQSGKVLLFAADAQTGNWLSWEDIEWTGSSKGLKMKQLYANTVLYKVGHHASHNATLKQGLEAMTNDELVAMIPVNANDSNITKVNGWKMPANNLYKRLKEKTKNRVLRMDSGYADDCDPAKDSNTGWADLKHQPEIDSKGLFVEYTVSA